MEIGPITNVRPWPAPQSQAPELELPAVFQIEYSSRTGDETYSPNRGKSAAGDDEDQQEEETTDSSGDTPSEPAMPSSGPRLGSQINFFA